MDTSQHLRQGNELLKSRKKLHSNIEGFENKELWNDGTEYKDSIDQVVQKDLDELKALEDKFMTALGKYTETYKLYMEDALKTVDGESSNYLGKNIKTNDGVISYINNLGLARPYESNEVFTGRHETCGSNAINVNVANVSALNFNRGAPMFKNAPCGFDGLNVFIDSKSSNTINLSSMTGIQAGQSSTFQENTSSYGPSKAIDGNINTFNHTHVGNNESWFATLPSECFIEKISITNRQDCCQDGLKHFSIEISDKSGNIKYNYTENIASAQNIYHFDGLDVIGSKITITQLLNDMPLHMAEVQIWGTEKESVDHGNIGYVDGNGNLHEYPNNQMLQTGSCPTGKVGIGYDLWQLFTKGAGMSDSSVCNLGKINAQLSIEVENLNNELMNITQEINNKTLATKERIASMKSQHSLETQYLNDQLTRFTGMYEKYNSIDNKSYNSLDAMVGDTELVNNALLFKYILWTMIATGVIIITIRHIR